jgi:Holliday junction resolvase
MRAAKVDANQGEIVSALRKVGVSVQSLATIGKGCPDLIAAKTPDMWLIEIKGAKGKLTPDQVEWIHGWRGVVHIVRSVDEALELVGVSQVRDL